MILRKTDAPGKAIFRSERLFCSNGQWFVLVREGKQLGPFDSRHDAAVELVLPARSGDSAAAGRHIGL